LLPPGLAQRDYSPAEQQHLEKLRARALVGSGPEVAQKLRDLAQTYGVDELVLITWASEPEVQRRSYEILAREFALT
jgi:alkanesulfonate monooxygenase SsuD/methylene tetrahydromethanopterin reductase-like flavin-dependent oxidoreductase (luciferase family)